jgi:hypothetical protein
MLSITLEIAMFASFIALMIVIWRVSKWPRWRIRAVVYGWAAVFFWAMFWAGLMPILFRHLMDAETRARTFPDGTIAAAALFGGWFWPSLVVMAGVYRDRRKTGGGHVA